MNTDQKDRIRSQCVAIPYDTMDLNSIRRRPLRQMKKGRERGHEVTRLTPPEPTEQFPHHYKLNHQTARVIERRSGTHEGFFPEN